MILMMIIISPAARAQTIPCAQGAPSRRSLLGSAFDDAMHDPNKGAKLEAKVEMITIIIITTIES